MLNFEIKNNVMEVINQLKDKIREQEREYRRSNDNNYDKENGVCLRISEAKEIVSYFENLKCEACDDEVTPAINHVCLKHFIKCLKEKECSTLSHH